jgi:hypothetical protein
MLACQLTLATEVLPFYLVYFELKAETSDGFLEFFSLIF